ncbi:MAG: Peptidase S9 prolyl oligopeptidase active site domain protein [Parcubacteria group bacterium GW2011_GWA1_44_13]|uniref:Peptidase S9 prolyl oligopeptidase active site domain protein n=1 Tax=Candidatus Nomurabacteria bacterium GW2011_GWB1_44_12 TaxID=1618748 RepID=A0A837IEB8_9BACT|nr:MAG: Peptidase S9 prolyl oligopeptidase active site domain protein [Candidatus Nomurabacteria bacterium GW2011_GWD1_44_10]KKT37252.1 MAG: Peptidase S9 prolyl oligopeptidase active site domain protein [Candidatus Nomurabacteria bacterium GW2011_GWB1_44_12]KKT38563.1 MAG: Peptidase S9 prolyl oligopeptidase active site domain protein [Parcubacteria group bacterium GW2011_GWA1_44_13]KKT60963.1 MAG: Peptidase S9 prolyl oligopeptidase active site domain protein [Parcubacteria group bacterium GW2011
MDKKYTIKDFLDIESTGSPIFNFDGTKVAYLSNATGVSQIYLVSRDGGEAKQLTSYDDSVNFAVFSPTRDEIIFGKSNGGDENVQLFLFDIAQKSVRALTQNPKIQHRWGGWSQDGKFITYSSNERDGTDFDVYVMDVESGKSKVVFGDSGSCDSLGFSPNGTMVAVRKRHTGLTHDLYLVNLQSDEVMHITDYPENPLVGFINWLSNEKGFFFITNRERDFAGLAFYDLETKTERYILTPEWDVEGITKTINDENLIVMINEDGYRNMTIHATKDMKPFEHQNFPKGVAGYTQWSRDGKYIVFTLSSGTKNSDVWVWSKDENKYWQITHSKQGVPQEVLVEPKLVKYQSFDELEIPAFLFLPKEKLRDKKLPVIVHIHGGPEGQFRPSFNSLIQYFVYQGYAVIAPNVRGSSGYGKKYLALDDIHKRMDSVTDLQYLHKFLENNNDLDTSKVVLWGASYGGYMVLAGLTFHPELWVAGVDIVGISNLVSFLENTSPYRRALREAEYGYLSTDREFLESISPLNFIENIKAPLFIIHGANDPRVPLSEAEQMYSKLKDLGREVELLVYQDEGHGLNKSKNRMDAYPKVAEFLGRIFDKKP